MANANQPLPGASLTELAPGSAFAPAATQQIPVFAGPCSRGPLNTPTAYGPGDVSDLVSTFGTGQAVKRAARFAKTVAQPFVFLRLTTASVAAFTSAATVVKNPSSDFTSTLSGTPTDGNDVLITFTLGGTTGTGPISYTVSLDGGLTTGTVQSLATATTIVVNGVTVTLGSAKTVTTGDTIAWWTKPASGTVLPQTFTGTGTSAITVTGAPLDAYEVAFKVVAGGTVGTAGITFQYSLDYGAPAPTWSPTIALGTATTFLLLDGYGVTSSESTGNTLNFGSGNLVAGDLFTFNTSEPTYDATGLTAGLTGPTPQTSPPTGLATWNGSWSFVVLCGPQPEAVVADADAIVAGWDSINRPSWAVCDARDHGSTETLAAWSTRVGAEFSPYTSTHVGVSAGMARCLDPITGRSNRRPVMFVLVSRAVAWPLFSDWAQFDQGSLPADVTLQNVAQQTIEHDASADPSLNAQGLITLRQWPGVAGVYPTRACLPGPDNDIKLIPLRRVMNEAKKIQHAFQQSEVASNFRVYKSGDPTPAGFVPGNMYAADWKKLQRIAANDYFRPGLISTGFVSGYTYTINKAPISLGGGSYQLVDSLQITARIYVSNVDGTAQFVSATYDVLSTKAS